MIIDTIFKILNFIVFCALVVYYFRKNIITAIKKELRHKKDASENLMHQGLAASSEYCALHDQLEIQKELYAILDNKVELWQSVFKKKAAQTVKERQLNENAILERLQKQRQHLEEYDLIGCILPRVQQETEHELQAYFQDAQHGKAFNQNIIQQLQPNR